MADTISIACCNTLPVGEPDTAVGLDFDRAAGIDLYVTGNKSSKRGVVLVYDIFGLYPQTKQGANLLAREVDGVVIVPDFFEGQAADISWLPMDTEEKKTKLMGFFAEKANPVDNLNKLLAVMKEAKLSYPSVEKWAILGLCWGGKVAVLASGSQSLFAVSGQAHPSLLDVLDAKAITIPHICLASPEEPAAVIELYANSLDKERAEFETYDTMFHGWMGARANLQDRRNAEEFDRGYKQVATFFRLWL
ncbi:hypothetical protein VE00_07919 [Pseudogymnoascus sp. WSF 3629]|nr:hypothetical protein VE00_07919 [Pseudogymnoascus sp. WSF 3629]